MPVEIKLYRPSNGTEGSCFHSKWCRNCARDSAMNEGLEVDECNDDQLCEILGDTFIYSIDDPEYPKEWRHCNETGYPICTAFVPIGEEIPKNFRDDKTIDMFEES